MSREAASEPQIRPDEFPMAAVRGPKPSWRQLLQRYSTRFWWLTLVSLVVAVVLVASVMGTREPEITVTFQKAHGLKAGDALRYRGTEIGRVVRVKLHPALDRVEVRIALERQAAALAREGSRFWIERPRLSLSRVSGLETVVGANYVGVVPGPSDARAATVFQGLETPPTLGEPAEQEITIRFADGHGLAVGDVLKHHGIVVGETSAVELADDLSGVVVRVQLIASADRLARAGSRFWIERPQVSLSQVRGLETLVGGRYIAVLPGPAGAPRLQVFDGLDQPPAVRQYAEGGLEIVLESPDRAGLEPGAPLAYRGISIGNITSVNLASDATHVEARAYVRPESRELVRDNTRFWAIGGIELSMGWSGVRMDMESLSTVTAGGVALGTPDPPGKPVATGHRFALEAKADSEWLEWRPTIPVGSSLLPDGLPLPNPWRASLHWRQRNLVGRLSDRQLDGWLLALDDGSLLAPSNLISPPQQAADAKATLALAGREITIERTVADRSSRLSLLKAPAEGNELPHRWPRARMRAPEAPEDCLLVTDPQGKVLPVSAGRLTKGDDVWTLDPSLSLDRSWHGASAVSRRDGHLVGLVHVEDAQAAVVPLTASLLAP